jgi:TetR/AcrR family tetracycline transcriptional repressor
VNKPLLSRESVLEKALAIADAEGLAAVTIRRIAGEFGVTPMAMYWHFANKEELLAALGQRLWNSVEVDPEASLRELLTILVEALRAHPAIAGLADTQMLSSEGGLAVTERALELLAGSGFSVAEASAIARNAMQLAATMVIGEPGADVGISAAEREALVAMKCQRIGELSQQKYPRIVAAASALTEVDDVEEYYRVSIDLFVAGVETMARSRSLPGFS